MNKLEEMAKAMEDKDKPKTKETDKIKVGDLVICLQEDKSSSPLGAGYEAELEFAITKISTDGEGRTIYWGGKNACGVYAHNVEVKISNSVAGNPKTTHKGAYEIMADIGTQLKLERNKQKITQRQLAVKIGTISTYAPSQTTVMRVEKGSTQNIAAYIRTAQGLGIKTLNIN